MKHADTATTSQGIRAWHLALAVVAIGVILRVGLGSMPEPAPQRVDAERTKPNHTAEPTTTDPDVVEIVPFDVHGEVPGPLLTRILQRYMPESTADHADTLRDTLPPSEDPRMIVIIPDEDGATF